MKYLSCGLLLLLSACSLALPPPPEQLAIIKYLKQNTPNLANYEALRWSTPVAYTRSDSLARAHVVGQREDTTRLGTQLFHPYRHITETGAVVEDSAHFLLTRSGKVVVL
jgi:hypothetical protein